VQDEVTGRGLAVIQALPGAVSWSPDGRLELVVARNAAKETVFGLFGIPGHPARGIEKEPYAFHFALMVTRAGDWCQNRVHRLAWEMADGPWADARMAALRKMAHTAIAVDNDDVRVVAVKPAWRGRGIIVRLEAPQPLSIPVHVTVPGRAIARAWLCDARERDLAPLKVSPHGVQVAMAASILTLRIETEPAPLQPPPDT
jgi:GNAT superfamily N-acetyltransferase